MTSPALKGAPLLEARLEAPGLVFVGIGIHWVRRPSDLETHTLLAEQWRSQFSTWSIQGREVDLDDRRNRYQVSLTDGSAQFLIETVHGYERAMEQVPQLLDRLPTEVRSSGHGRLETQYLRPSRKGFQDRLTELAPRLIAGNFPASMSSKLKDFAYMADFDIEGENFQFHIGVVSRAEVSRRVFATVANPPAVATFCNIAQEWDDINNAGDCTAALDRTLAVGRRIMSELE